MAEVYGAPPPAIPGWPILGNICDVSPDTLQADLTRLIRTHGNVFMLKLPGKRILVLSSAAAILEACYDREDDFASRPHMPYIFRKAMYDCNDVTFLKNGEPHGTLRKCLKQNVDSYTEPAERLDALLKQEFEDMMSCFKEMNGKAFDPMPYMMKVMDGVFVEMITGEPLVKHSQIDAGLTSLGESLAKCTSLNYGTNLEICPPLRWLPVESTNTLRRAQEAEKESVCAMFAEAKRDFDPDRPPRGFADVLLKLQKDSGKDVITDKHVKGGILSFFFGGVLPTATVVKDLMLICLHHPAVLQKIQAEIHDIIGENEAPSLHHKADMPYVSAIVLEVLRYGSPVNFIPRETIRDTKIDGYHVPQGIMVLLDIFDANHNEADWPAPWEFKPERFLDENGKLVPEDHPARKRLMSFGGGSRKCVGSKLAVDASFLLITTICQKFSFFAETEDKIPSCNPRDFFPYPAVHPKDVKLRLVEKQS